MTKARQHGKYRNHVRKIIFVLKHEELLMSKAQYCNLARSRICSGSNMELQCSALGLNSN